MTPPAISVLINCTDAEAAARGCAVAIEVPAQKQAEQWQRQQLLEKWHRVAIERHAKHVAEQNHRQTPEGKRELVALHAAQNPGGIVTTGVNGCPELDAFGPDATDIFK